MPALPAQASSHSAVAANPSVHYAGIGSRETPLPVLGYMRRVAGRLAARGFILRSGAADGADRAFEEGCAEAGGQQEIWLPWKGFNGHADTGLYPGEAHIATAQQLHPAWDRLGRGPRMLHARNVGQVLGAALDAPVAFVLCWTKDGAETAGQCSARTGGTGMAIKLASQRGIPVINLRREGGTDRLAAQVRAIIGDGATLTAPG